MASSKRLRTGVGADKPRFGGQQLVFPKTENQQRVVDCWDESELLFLVGLAGVGKTHLALGLALEQAFNYKRDDGPKPKILLTRPMVGVDEEVGLFPGDVTEKMIPWLAPFFDVLGGLTNETWEQVQERVEIELVPFSMLRGRTVSRNQVLIADETQSATIGQLKCLLTRIGKGGKIVVCGDPSQSDKFNPDYCPLSEVARKLSDLDGVSVITFNQTDQQRSELVNKVLERL